MSVQLDIDERTSSEVSESESQFQHTVEHSQWERAAAALWQLWSEQELDSGEPLIFLHPRTERARHHQAALLDAFQETPYAQECKIQGWKRLDAPPSAGGIAAIPYGFLLKEDHKHEATCYSPKANAGLQIGWLRVDFSGWSALSVLLTPHVGRQIETTGLVAVPAGRQDEWLAFQQALLEFHLEVLHEHSRNRLEIVGEMRYGSEEAIRRALLSDVILPQQTLDLVAQQRSIFEPSILRRYSLLGLSHKRLAVLYGPPGTGKTTLLKAEGAEHLRSGGGLVLYIAAKEKNWELLEEAMVTAADAKVPSLILVEDFEQFVREPRDLHKVLNVLDGVGTPDNPAGTLMLATSNDPESISPRIKDRPGRIDVLIEVGPIADEAIATRFLRRYLGEEFYTDAHGALVPHFIGQTGAHVQQVCMQAGLRAFGEGAETIPPEALLWAHNLLLEGREKAADERTCEPPRRRHASMNFADRKR